MQEKWLIAVDLDGTLFHTDHQISSRTLGTVHEVVDRGHHVVVITGRSSFSSVSRLRLMPDGIRLVCSNGAYEYDRQRQTITWANPLDFSMVVYLQSRIRNALPHVSFGWETSHGLGYEPQFLLEAGGAHTLEQGGPVDVPLQSEVMKLFVRTPERNGSKLAGMLSSLLENDIEVSSSGAPFAEITAAGANKGSALSKIAAELDISANRTMAFGDNLNDAPMLCWAGESVAMANAIPEVKAIASSQTLSNAEDGVACHLDDRFVTD